MERFHSKAGVHLVLLLAVLHLIVTVIGLLTRGNNSYHNNSLYTVDWH